MDVISTKAGRESPLIVSNSIESPHYFGVVLRVRYYQVLSNLDRYFGTTGSHWDQHEPNGWCQWNQKAKNSVCPGHKKCGRCGGGALPKTQLFQTSIAPYALYRNFESLPVVISILAHTRCSNRYRFSYGPGHRRIPYPRTNQRNTARGIVGLVCAPNGY